MTPDGSPPRARRLVVALVVGALAGALAGGSILFGRGQSDFGFWWLATRVWLAGGDPYAMLPGTAAWPLPDRLFYPLPTLVVTVPVAWLPLPWAAAVGVGAASALLAWALTRDAWWRLLLLVNPTFVMAVKVGQWTPLLTATALLPAASFLTAVKPTLGAAVLAYRPTVRAFLTAAASAAAFAALTLALVPTWPARWLANLPHVVSHPAPLATGVGLLVLLALPQWREREARLLVAYAAVPQLLFFADQLPLGLVARTRGEARFLSACGLAAWAAWFAPLRDDSLYVLEAAPWVLAGVYLPALLVVVRRAAWVRTLGARVERHGSGTEHREGPTP